MAVVDAVVGAFIDTICVARRYTSASISNNLALPTRFSFICSFILSVYLVIGAVSVCECSLNCGTFSIFLNKKYSFID